MENQDKKFRKGLASCMAVIANISLFLAMLFGGFVITTGRVYSVTCASHLKGLTDNPSLGEFYVKLSNLCYSYVLPITLLTIAVLFYLITAFMLKEQALEKIDLSLFVAGVGTLVLGLCMNYICFFLEGVLSQYAFNEKLSNAYGHNLILIASAVILLATVCFLADVIIHRVKNNKIENEADNV